MAFADLRTDWSLLSALLRLAQRDGWEVVFGNDLVVIVHRRAEQGVVVLPAPLLGHAREAGGGWGYVRQRGGKNWWA